MASSCWSQVSRDFQFLHSHTIARLGLDHKPLLYLVVGATTGKRNLQGGEERQYLFDGEIYLVRKEPTGTSNTTNCALSNDTNTPSLPLLHQIYNPTAIMGVAKKTRKFGAVRELSSFPTL